MYLQVVVRGGQSLTAHPVVRGQLLCYFGLLHCALYVLKDCWLRFQTLSISVKFTFTYWKVRFRSHRIKLRINLLYVFMYEVLDLSQDPANDRHSLSV